MIFKYHYEPIRRLRIFFYLRKLSFLVKPLFLYIMVKTSFTFNQFFHTPDRAVDEIDPKKLMLTKIVDVEPDGSSSVHILEKDIMPSFVFTFDDFLLTNLIKSGVSYKALSIHHDIRIGSDEQINAFNDYLSSISDKLFVESSN